MAKNFLETFFHKFFKKVLDIGGEHVYNVPVATKQEERNKDKRETEHRKKFKKVSKSA